MVKETGGKGEEEITPSDDAIAIAGSIQYLGDGLHAIARAIERLASVENGSDPDEEENNFYLDGTPK